MMFFITSLRIISILLGIVGITFFLPVGVALYCSEYSVLPGFIVPMAISFVFLIAVNIPTRKMKMTMNTRQTFFIVALAWICASLMGSVPLYFSGYFSSYIDAFFESVSGFSTTGATILGEVENLPRSINMWRCMTHWIGGMGIVTLTVALLPLLGVGGFQLIKAETTGPEKGKVTARITTTAKLLWIIYAGLTAAEAVALKIAGMDVIDAVSHALSTLGTGGFSTRNASIASYNSPAIEIIIMIFMFLAGINFSLFYYLIIKRFDDIRTNSEFKVYIVIVVLFSIAVALCLLPQFHNFGTALRYGVFQVLTIMTTTGFATADYLLWPSTAQFWLFILFFFGGCSGSTSGGIKVVRWVILGKQINNETKRMLHPHGIFAIRLNGRVGRKDIVFNVAAFISLYFLLIGITTFAGCLGHLDLNTAFTGALSMIGNVGPAFGSLGPACNYGFLPGGLKLWYCFAMLAGRLELYTMLIFFMPTYWKK